MKLNKNFIISIIFSFDLELIICLGHELGCVAHDSCGLSL